MKALVRVCGRKVGNCPGLLPYALWMEQTTHSSVARFMAAELMYEQKLIMPVEHTISSWAAIDWMGEMSQEELLSARIRLLEWRLEYVERAKAMLHVVREKNKDRFDRTHQLRPKKLEEGN